MEEKPILFSGPMVRALLEDRKTQTRRVAKQWLNVGGHWPFAVCPARESGWIGWHGLQNPKIAEFTKKAYTHGQKSPYEVGDRLWVRETWWEYKSPELRQCSWFNGGTRCLFPEGGFHDEPPKEIGGKLWVPSDYPIWRKRPSIHMPRWASRLTLEVTGVRAERLQDISEVDAKAEGCMEEPITQEQIDDTQISDCHPDEKALMLALGPGSWSAKLDFMMLWDTIHKADGPNRWNANPWVWVYEFRRVAK